MSDDPLVGEVRLSSLRVVDLREELDKRGLSKHGNKKELAERLREFLLSQSEGAQNVALAAPEDDKKTTSPLVARYREAQEIALREARKEAERIRRESASESGSPSKKSDVDFPESPQKVDVNEENLSEPPNVREDGDIGGKNKIQYSSPEIAAENANDTENQGEPEVKDIVEEPKSQEEESKVVENVEEPEVEDNVVSESKDRETHNDDEKVVEKQGDEHEKSSEHVEKVEKSQEGKEKYPESDEKVVEQEPIDAVDEMELDYEDDKAPESTSEGNKSPSNTPERSKSRSGEKDKSEEPKKYVEDRFDFLKKLSHGSPEDKSKKTTEFGLTRVKDPSPARNDESTYVHIQKLKRPFTNKSLLSLLGKFGEFNEKDNFWIADIKSNCIVCFNDVESAKRAREELDNVIWPVGSDTILSADFTTAEEFDARKNSTTVKKSEPEPPNLKIHVVNDEPDASTSSEITDRKESNDRRSPTRQDDQKNKLDELFIKTKAMPEIYYKPLTEEEAEARIASKKDAERQKERRDTPPIRRRSPPRFSSSSRRYNSPPRRSYNPRRRTPPRRSPSPDRKRDRRSSQQRFRR